MSDLLQKAEQFVFELFKDKLSSEHTYHNFLHTEFVVQKTKELIENEPVSEQEKELLLLAAWFHDTGHIQGAENHEAKSFEIAQSFLQENNFQTAEIESMKEIILNTCIGQEASCKLGKILRDADSAHLGSEMYEEISRQLRVEWELIHGKKLTDYEWNLENYNFLTRQHKYFTDYAKKNWQPVKMKNVFKIQSEIAIQQNEGLSKQEIKKKKLEKLERPERGIETMFRVTLNNHTRLSEIADNKANILLSVNAIIISIALSTLLPKLGTPKNAYLIVPTLTMLLVSVLSIIFAILATKPNITKGIFTQEDVQNKKVNLLFFGNFYKMPLDKYEAGMNEVMNDRAYLYNSLTRDLYFLGIVLHRKYKLLRLTYYIFMFGTIITVLAFVYAFQHNGGMVGLF